MIKTLAKSIREYKKASIISPVFVTFEVIMECIIPFVTASLVNSIQQGCDIYTILKYGAVLAVMAIISLSCGAIAGAACSKAACGFAKNLRKDMFYKIQSYSFKNIDKFSVSSLVTRLTTDIMNVQQSYMMIIRTAIRGPLMLIFSFVMAFVMGGSMAFIFIIVIPILAFALIMVARLAMPLFKKVFKKYDALNNSVQENVKGMRVVKSFVREEYEKEKFNFATEDVQKDFTKAERILAFNHPTMQFCLYAVMVFVLTYGSYMVITTNGLSLNVGHMSSMLTYGHQILMSLMMLSMIFVMLTLSSESARRIAEVLKEEPSIQNPENPILNVNDGSITFKDVCFKYDENAKRNTLENINLEIKSGETVGIIGQTGSSKTTFIQLISRLYDVTDGEVLVGGVNVKNYDLKTLRDSVAVVLQKNELFSGTIKENLRWGDINATDEEIIEACKLAQADTFINSFPDGYDTYIEQGGTNVSGGQKQRLCIARALIKKPKILILDDSTSAVDTRTDALIRKGFKEYIPNTTKLIIAQRIASVKEADKIIVFDGGKINAVGTHDELVKTNEIYRGVYEAQSKGGASLEG